MAHVVLVFLLVIPFRLVAGHSHQTSLHMQNLNFKAVPTGLLVDTLKGYPGVTQLYLTNNNIPNISRKDFPKSLSQLKYLSLQGNRIDYIEKGALVEMVNLVHVDFGDNLLSLFPDLQAPELHSLNLSHNGIQTIGNDALQNYRKLEELMLNDNPLTEIQEKGLVGPSALKLLYMRNTALTNLPSQGLSTLTGLNIESTPSLIRFPKAVYFTSLREANLTYSMHCCAFKYIKKKSSVSIPTSNKTNLLIAIMEELKERKKSDGAAEIKCLPQPDVFNPCNDVMHFSVLRAFCWIISICAIFLNLLLLIVLFQRSDKLSATKMLTYNQGFANLLMGIYLFSLCCLDADTFGSYFSYVRGWQFSGSCQAFGFIAVFSINIAMCTLVLLALERFLLVIYAREIGEEVNAKHAAYSIGVAWVYSLIIAVLPTSNQVSSYTQAAICLPLDIHNSASKGYVTWLLLSFIFASLIIAFFFFRILAKKYMDHAESLTSTVGIARYLQVITCATFLCWLPICAVGLCVLYTNYQFDIHALHFLIILFFPLHSFLSPMLMFTVSKPLRNDTWKFLHCSTNEKGEAKRSLTAHQTSQKPPKTNGKKVENFIHIEVPQDSRTLVNKHHVTVIDEHPELDDQSALYNSKPEPSKSFTAGTNASPYGKSYSYSPRCLMEDGDNHKRNRSVSADNKRYSEPRHRSDTGTTVSTAISANSNVELLEM